MGQVGYRHTGTIITDRNLAIAHDDTLHMFVPFDGERDSEPALRLHGLQLQARLIAIGATEPRWYLDVASQPQHEAPFNLVAREVVSAVLIDRIEPRRAARMVVQRWRAFWRSMPSSRLSHQEQIGLFGEVWTLAEVLIKQLGPQAVFTWTGPLGERHDFQGRNAHLEVKVTERHEPIFRISGLHQLEVPEGRRLGLLAIGVSTEAGAADGLVPVIRRVESLLADNADELQVFRQALGDAGYHPEHDDDLDRLRLRLRSADMFEVDGNFPRLTPAEFPDGLPSGIVGLDYDIDLASLDPLGEVERTLVVDGLEPLRVLSST